MIAQYRVFTTDNTLVARVAVDVSADERRWGAALACDENRSTAEAICEEVITDGGMCYAFEEHYTRHALPEGDGWEDVGGGDKPARLLRVG